MEGQIVRTIKDFLTTKDGELCVNQDEYLQVIEKVDRHWVKCRMESREGLIPSSHITQVENIPKISQNQCIFKSTRDYPAQGNGQISFKKGEIIIGLELLDGGEWWNGYVFNVNNLNEKLTGIFPTNQCWRLDPLAYLKQDDITSSSKTKILKFAQVIHGMTAQLEEEIDLVEGQQVVITEFIDKDWYRGECNGRSGIFPASFVRIVDSFPGDLPPHGADLRCYLKAQSGVFNGMNASSNPKSGNSTRSNNDYMNTQNAFPNLSESLKALEPTITGKSDIDMMTGRPSDRKGFSNVITHDTASRETNDRMLANLPQSMLEDDYFRQNLPATYGTVSLPPSENDTDLNDFAFEREFKLCSKGYEEMSNNLSAFAQSKVSWTASYQHSDSAQNWSTINDRFGNKRSGLLNEPGYGQLNDNLSSIFHTKNNGNLFDDFHSSTNIEESKRSNDFMQNSTDVKKSDNNRVHPYDTTSIPGIYDNYGAPTKSINTMENNLHSTGIKVQEFNDATTFSFDPLRYENVTYDNLGGEKHIALSVDVRPYGIAKFNFFAQFDNELSLEEGDMVYLRKYIDDEWMEGEVNGKRGLVPIGYINIIVDCLEVVEKPSNDALQATKTKDAIKIESTLKSIDSNGTIFQLDPLLSNNQNFESSEKVSSKIKPGTYHKVLYTFQAQMDGDLNIVEGEVIRVLESGNENVHWLNVENTFGECGLCPANHLDPTEEYDGKVLFDIDRLLSYKHQPTNFEDLDNKDKKNEPSRNESNVSSSSETKCTSDLKFFDPLCSPDNDMLLVEAELERKAREANMLPIQETVARKRREQLARFSNHHSIAGDSMNSVPPEKRKLMNSEKITNIDDFISTNINRLDKQEGFQVINRSTQQKSAVPYNRHNAKNQLTSYPTQNTNPFIKNNPERESSNIVSSQLNKIQANKLEKKDTSNLASSQLDISKSIYMELKGNRPRKPAPPRPSEPPKLQTALSSDSLKEDNKTSSLKRFHNKSPIPPPKPPPPLVKAMSNAKNASHDLDGIVFPSYDGSSSMVHQMTDPASIDSTATVSKVSSSMEVQEPLYAKVNKSLINTYSFTGTKKDDSSESKKSLYQNSILQSSPGKKPPRPPKLQTAMISMKERTEADLSSCLQENDLMNQEETSIDGPRYEDVYSTKGSVVGKKYNGIETVAEEPCKEIKTPTNENNIDQFANENFSVNDAINEETYGVNTNNKSLVDHVPKVPQRTSSCSMRKVIDEWHQRNMNININKSLNSVTYHRTPSHFNNVKEPNNNISRGYMNIKDASTNQSTSNGDGDYSATTPFPPDRDSLMSPPPSENPPRIQTLPYRCVSVGSSSIKSRSVFYASVPSDRGDSPSYSSLNHSYETLNMSDNGDSASVVASNTDKDKQENVPRVPHRPAPPIPAPKYKMTSVERKYLGEHLDEYNSQVEYEEWKDSMARTGDEMTLHNKSKARHPMSRRTLRQRKIQSVKRQIQIKEKMLEEPLAIKEQLLRELDLYQEIAVAKGTEYDRLNQRMDKVQDNIEKLSDDIQRLQACLADEELKAEEDTIEETKRRAEEQSRRAQLEVQMREEEKRMREERIAKNKERRENVINELAVTERDFCRDLKLTWQAFGLDTPAMLEQRNVDVSSLFGNLSDIIEVSEQFLESLQMEAKNNSSVSDQNVGSCFLQHAEAMKTAYTDYCVNHDKAEQLMEKYESTPDISRLLQRGVETIQAQVSCFNMGSILIKPVQRILKYPLILNELVKCTEEDHRDKEDIFKAVTIMSNIAAFINESKRRKDIVDKYRTEEDKTLTRKFSKLNMHSINKKSTRMSQRLFSSLGMETTAKDAAFEDHEKRFNDLKESVQSFSNEVLPFREQLHDTIICQYNIAQNVADLYTAKAHAREVERFKAAHKKIISTYWNEFDMKLQKRVLKPLHALLETFTGPTRLIQKRQDKYLDYSASQQKSEKNKDPSRSKNLQEEVESCKSTYDALNSQLLEELPQFLGIGSDIYVMAIKEFISNRRLFVGRITQELLALMDLPLLASTTGDIIEVFLVKHSMVCNQISRFAFSSKTLRTSNEERPLSPQKTSQQQPHQRKSMIQSSSQKIHSPSRPSHPSTSGATLQIYLPSSPTPDNSKSKQMSMSNSDKPVTVIQTANTRMLLRGKYASAKLFQANQNYVACKNMEVSVQAGDLVGVIQQKDPMGDGTRWYVDIGTLQGFLPSHVLSSIGADQESVSVEGSDIKIHSETDQKNHSFSSSKPLDTQQNKIALKANENESISVLNDIKEVSEADYQIGSEYSDDWSSSHQNANETVYDTKSNIGDGNDMDNDVITTEAVVHAYDDVAPDETYDENVKSTKAQPVRKAPAPPMQKPVNEDYNAATTEPVEAGVAEDDEECYISNHDKQKCSISEEVKNSTEEKMESQDDIYGVTTDVGEEVEKGSSITVNSNSSGNTNSNDYSTNAQVGQDTDIERTGSHHSYEEIPPSEANSEPSQDLSPIYEEIHGGSRSSVSSGSGSSGGVGHRTIGFSRLQQHSRHQPDTDNNNQMKAKFYYSLYEFQATDQAVMLSLTKGQVVRIIPETNSSIGAGGAASAGLNDWCYVEDRYANRGYVPRQFLKLYDLGSLQLKMKK